MSGYVQYVGSKDTHLYDVYNQSQQKAIKKDMK